MDSLTDDVAEIARLIRMKVRGGSADAADVIAAVRANFGPDQIGDDSLQAWVADAFAVQADDETTWPDVTDCDRLDLALADVQRRGVLALSDAGPTEADALAAAASAYHAAGGDGSGVVGFCFYTAADADRAADDGELLLSFGDVDGDATAAAQVGRSVCDALEAAGFDVRWGGDRGERIAVVGLDWQRRRHG